MTLRVPLLLLMLLVACGAPPPAAPPQIRGDSPDQALADLGQQVFLNGPCVTCHTVRGTIALGRVGPDLTHLASRKTIAAGSMPNTRGHLAGWILNPQNLKPGTKMPPTLLSSDDLHALLAYLETLR